MHPSLAHRAAVSPLTLTPTLTPTLALAPAPALALTRARALTPTLALTLALALPLASLAPPALASPPAAFGVQGHGTAVLGRGVDPGAAALTADGRLRLLGVHARGVVVLGLDAAGRPDPSFGTSGRVDLPIAEGAFGSAAPALGRDGIGSRGPFGGPRGQLAVDAQGRVLLAVKVSSDGARATATKAADPRQWALVARLTPAGALDPSFGQGGGVLVPIGWDSGAVHALALAADGGAFIGGRGDLEGRGAAVWRVTAKGAHDKAFGKRGTAVFAAGLGAAVALVATRGELYVGLSDDYAAGTVARLSLRGALDKRFGKGGYASVDGLGALHALALDASGPKPRIVVGGGPGGERPGRVARLLATGALDTAFASGGLFTAGPSERFIPGLHVAGGRVWALATRFHTPSTSALIALSDAGTREPAVGGGASVPVSDPMSAELTALQLLARPDGWLFTVAAPSSGAGAVSLGLWAPEGRRVGTAPPQAVALPDPARVRPITDPVAPVRPVEPTPPPPPAAPVTLCTYTSYKEEASTSAGGGVWIEPVFYWAPACGGKCCDRTASAKLEDYAPSLCCVRGAEEQCGSGRWDNGISRWVASCPVGFVRRDPVFGDPRYQR